MMRTRNQLRFRSLRLWAVLALFASSLSLSQAQDHRHKQSLSKTYPASRTGTLVVENKYGKIEVLTWEKDSVAIFVEIQLTESSASKLRKLRDDVQIDFSGTRDYILAKTVIQSESGRLARELRSISHTISGTNKRMEINYLVQAPAYLDVVLSNKFGDIFMDDLEGSADIDLSNGVLKANHLSGTSSIALSFGNGMIKSLGSASIELSYSDLTLTSASQLDLVSKSSRLDMDEVNVLKINSRRDKLYVKKAEYLYGISSFSQVRISDFLKECDLQMKYGKLTVEHVVPGFSKIFVESEYADLNLYFDREASFDFDILHHEKALLRLPGEVEARENPSGKEHFNTVGSMGRPSGDGNESRVQINALQKCYIQLDYQ